MAEAGAVIAGQEPVSAEQQHARMAIVSLALTTTMEGAFCAAAI